MAPPIAPAPKMMYLVAFSMLIASDNIAFDSYQSKGVTHQKMITEKATRQHVNLYYDLYVPYTDIRKPMPLIIGLHGYEGNKESMMAMLNRIRSRDFIKASVQGPNSFFVRNAGDERNPKIGFGWMMQYKSEETIRLHHETLSSIIEDTAAQYLIDRDSVFLIAFSQSVSLNYRFAFTHPNSVRGVIAVCGGIPGDWDQDKYHNSDTDVLIIAGETDEFYPLERTRGFKDALARRARSVEFKSFPVGHVFPRESLPIIEEWIVERTNADSIALQP
jgi:predicted esterase